MPQQNKYDKEKENKPMSFLEEKLKSIEAEFDRILESHLIILSENQKEAIIRQDKKDSQRLWKDQMNAIKDFYRLTITSTLQDFAEKIRLENAEIFKNEMRWGYDSAKAELEALKANLLANNVKE